MPNKNNQTDLHRQKATHSPLHHVLWHSGHLAMQLCCWPSVFVEPDGLQANAIAMQWL